MACIVLGTDLLVALLRGKEAAINYVSGLEKEGQELATTVINLFELYYGAYRSGPGRGLGLSVASQRCPRHRG